MPGCSLIRRPAGLSRSRSRTATEEPVAVRSRPSTSPRAARTSRARSPTTSTLPTEAFTHGQGLRRLVLMHQVHGADVHVVDEGNLDGPTPIADALVTTLPGVGAGRPGRRLRPGAARRPAAGVVGAVHAGRPGLVAGVVQRAVETMRGLGATDDRGVARAARVRRLLRGARADACRRRGGGPGAFAQTSWGTPAVDIGAGVLAQLDRDGRAGQRRRHGAPSRTRTSTPTGARAPPRAASARLVRISP